MKELDAIILENFKIFKGEHIIRFSDLNIFTGANNSGKSTVIKAIKFLSNGLERGDFPTLDPSVPELNLGSFSELVNKDSGADYFGIGFFVRLKNVAEPFKVMYRFKDGNTSVFSEADGKALFYSLEVFDHENKNLFAIYQTELYKVKKENIEYNYDYLNSEFFIKKAKELNIPVEEIEDNLDKVFGLPFPSPSDNQYPGRLLIKINIETLKRYILKFSNHNYGWLITHFDNIKGDKGNWWGEYYLEDDFDGYDFSLHRFNDFISEMLKETDKNYYYKNFCYYNFAGNELKHDLLEDSDIEDEIYKYDKIIEYGEVNLFVRDIVGGWFEAISNKRKTLRKNEIIHIRYEEKVNRLILANSSNYYLRKLFLKEFEKQDEGSRFLKFSYDALQLFGFKSFIEIKSHINSAYEINFVDNVQIKKKDNMNFFARIFYDNYIKINEYKNNPRTNISDLGRGLSNIMMLIIKTYSILNLTEEKDKIGGGPLLSEKSLDKKTVLIEEPEVFLHPNWQSKLADFLVMVQKRFDIKLIVETHSEYLLRRLQYLVAKKEIKPSKINIVYFYKPEKRRKKQYYKLTMRKDGLLDKDFGEGFFDEASKLTIDLLKIQNMN